MPQVNVKAMQANGALTQGIAFYGWHGHNGFVGPRRGFNPRVYPMADWNSGLGRAPRRRSHGLTGGLGLTSAEAKSQCEDKGYRWNPMMGRCFSEPGVEYNLHTGKTIQPTTSAPRTSSGGGSSSSQPQRHPTAPIESHLTASHTQLSAEARRWFESRGLQIQCRQLTDRWFSGPQGGQAGHNCRIGENGNWTDWKFGVYALNINPSVAAGSLTAQGVVQRQLRPTPGGGIVADPVSPVFKPDIVRLSPGEAYRSDQLGPDGKPLPGAVNVASQTQQTTATAAPVASSPAPSPAVAAPPLPPSPTPGEVQTQGWFPTDEQGRPTDSGFAPITRGPSIFGGDVVAMPGGEGSMLGGSVNLLGMDIPLWAIIAGAGVAVYAMKR